MAKETVLYLPATATALKLLTAIYKTPAIKIQDTSESVRSEDLHIWLTLNQAPKLELENGEEITGENTISEFLGDTHEKSIHWTPELRAESLQWLSRSSKFTSSPEEVYVCSPNLERDLMQGIRLLDGNPLFRSSHRATIMGRLLFVRKDSSRCGNAASKRM